MVMDQALDVKRAARPRLVLSRQDVLSIGEGKKKIKIVRYRRADAEKGMANRYAF